jgi:hypothetical protein
MTWNNYLASHQLPTLGAVDSVDQDISRFNDEDPLYKGVFESNPKNYKFPILFKRYRTTVSGSQNFVNLFATGTGDPFLLYSNRSNGRIIMMTSPLAPAFTNFQNHALFAATFLRIAETASLQKPLYLTIGSEENYPLNVALSEKNPVHLKSEDFGTDVIPQVINTANNRYISFSHLEDAIRNAGFYTLSDGAEFESAVAMNYHRQESNVDCLEEADILTGFDKSGWSSVNALEIGARGAIEINELKATEYWRILLIFAIVFIGTEIALLKLWKT